MSASETQNIEKPAKESRFATKPAIPIDHTTKYPAVVLGLPLFAPSIDIPLECLDARGKSRRPISYYLANVSFKALNDAQEDADFYQALIGADFLFPTGTPAHITSRVFGLTYANSASHWTVVRRIMDYAEEHELSVYLIGQRSQSSSQMKSRIASRRPNLKLVGESWIWPEEWSTGEALKINQELRSKKPDIVFASLSHVPAKTWLAENAKTLASALVYDLGSSEALFTRLVSLPVEKKRYSWIFRLLNKVAALPQTNYAKLRRTAQFIYHVFTQYQNQRTCQNPAPPFPKEAPFPLETGEGYLRVKLPERFDRAFLNQFRDEWSKLPGQSRGVILDASGVLSFDMVSVGTMLHLARVLRNLGCHLVIQDPCLSLVRFLQYTRMSKVLLTRYNASAAEDLARSPTWDHPTSSIKDSETIFWRGNVTAQTVDDIWDETITKIRSAEGKFQNFNIDLAGVTLLDSTGIGTMIKLKKRLNSNGYRVAFKNAKQNVTKILNMTHLSDYLLRSQQY